MKLSTKLLTTLSSIAVVGTVIPASVSCGCSKDTYIFNYKDHINCRDKDDENYHKPEEVRAAAKIRAAKAKRRVDYKIGDISSELQATEDHGQQFYFNDLVASIVITQNDTINLKDWVVTEQIPGALSYSFTLNGVTYPHIEDTEVFTYARNPNDPLDRTIYLLYRGGTFETDLMYKSYVFSDCLWEEEV